MKFFPGNKRPDVDKKSPAEKSFIEVVTSDSSLTENFRFLTVNSDKYTIGIKGATMLAILTKLEKGKSLDNLDRERLSHIDVKRLTEDMVEQANDTIRYLRVFFRREENFYTTENISTKKLFDFLDSYDHVVGELKNISEIPEPKSKVDMQKILGNSPHQKEILEDAKAAVNLLEKYNNHKTRKFSDEEMKKLDHDVMNDALKVRRYLLWLEKASENIQKESNRFFGFSKDNFSFSL